MIPKYHNITIQRTTYITLGVDQNDAGHYMDRMLAVKDSLFGRAFAQVIKFIDEYSGRLFRWESKARGFKEGDLFPKLSLSYGIMLPYRLLQKYGHKIDGNQNPDGVIDVEHVFSARHMLPASLWADFPRG